MPLYLGIPFTIFLMAIAASLHVGRMSFEWVVALGGALWAAWQSRRHGLQQFERVFPLEPLALGATVLFLFPVTFPWFLRLRHKALRGRLPVRTRPSRLRLALLIVAIAGGLVLNIGYGVLRRTAPWKSLEAGSRQLRAMAGGALTYELREGALAITIENEALVRVAPSVQRDTAEAIARAWMAHARSAFGPLSRQVDTIHVRFIYYPGSRLDAPSESPTYSFPTSTMAPERRAAPNAISLSCMGSASSARCPTRPDRTRISVGISTRTVVPISGLL